MATEKFTIRYLGPHTAIHVIHRGWSAVLLKDDARPCSEIVARAFAADPEFAVTFPAEEAPRPGRKKSPRESALPEGDE